MKRRRKIRYYVQNWNSLNIWWTNGKWSTEISKKLGGSSTKYCRNLRNALHNARQIILLGGSPLISRCYRINGRMYWLDFKLNKSEIDKLKIAA